jgi:hypothetical protein
MVVGHAIAAVTAASGRGLHGFTQEVHDDGVGHEVAAADTCGDGPADGGGFGDVAA